MKRQPPLLERLNKLEYEVLLSPYAKGLVDSMCKRDRSACMEWLDKNLPVTGWRDRTEAPEIHGVTEMTDSGDDDE